MSFVLKFLCSKLRCNLVGKAIQEKPKQMKKIEFQITFHDFSREYHELSQNSPDKGILNEQKITATGSLQGN